MASRTLPTQSICVKTLSRRSRTSHTERLGSRHCPVRKSSPTGNLGLVTRGTSPGTTHGRNWKERWWSPSGWVSWSSRPTEAENHQDSTGAISVWWVFAEGLTTLITWLNVRDTLPDQTAWDRGTRRLSWITWSDWTPSEPEDGACHYCTSGGGEQPKILNSNSQVSILILLQTQMFQCRRRSKTPRVGSSELRAMTSLVTAKWHYWRVLLCITIFHCYTDYIYICVVSYWLYWTLMFQ